jgi:putative redox protein
MSLKTLTATLGSDRFATVMSTRQHTLVADEPVELGGQDSAADPYEYLMAALASCTAITVRMYADRKEWPLEGVDVEVAMAGGQTPTLARTLHLRGALDVAQRARLLQIADACPISKMLTAGVSMTSALAGDDR